MDGWGEHEAFRDQTMGPSGTWRDAPGKGTEQPRALLPKKDLPQDPYHLGGREHQDDEPHLTGILPPVLWAHQTADAHVPLQQGLGGTSSRDRAGHTAHSCHPWKLELPQPKAPKCAPWRPLLGRKKDQMGWSAHALCPKLGGVSAGTWDA